MKKPREIGKTQPISCREHDIVEPFSIREECQQLRNLKGRKGNEESDLEQLIIGRKRRVRGRRAVGDWEEGERQCG